MLSGTHHRNLVAVLVPKKESAILRAIFCSYRDWRDTVSKSVLLGSALKHGSKTLGSLAKTSAFTVLNVCLNGKSHSTRQLLLKLRFF